MLKSTIEKFERLNVIRLYVDEKFSLNQLQNIIQSDKRTIRDYLLANDIEVNGIISSTIIPNKNILGVCKSDKRFNYNKFDIIDTEEKAYWLGFIFADGYVSNKEFTFELGLKASDVGHLHKFNRFIECVDNNIKYHPKITIDKIYDSYRWNIRNEKLWNALNSYGCTPNKSLILKFPNIEIFKDKLLIRHFIRGYWDGDGCISFTPKTKIISVLGTVEFLNEMKIYVPTLINNNIYKHKSKNDKTFSIQTNFRKAYETLKYLYNDSTIYLDRKYEKYLDFCRLYEESYRLLETKNGES
jgi:hypothetical protein